MRRRDGVDVNGFRPCPLCGSPSTKAMFAGLPMWLCGGESPCYCVFGGLSCLLPVLAPFTVGDEWVLIRYENYWSCLWEFVTGESNRKAGL